MKVSIANLCVYLGALSQGAMNLQALTLSMLERPTEPVFMPKGNKGIILDVPANYLVRSFFQIIQIYEKKLLKLFQACSKCSFFKLYFKLY